MTPDELNTLIDQAIEQLSDDRVDSGIDILNELAVVWKTAGMTGQSFKEICIYIQEQAAEKSDSDFVHMKMRVALKESRERKHGVIIH